MNDIALNPSHASSASTSLFPVAGRLMLAAIFLLSGFAKATDPSGTIAYIASVNLPLPELGFVGAVIVELIGGLLLVIGYRTRLVAAILAAFTIVAALIFHFDLGDQNQFIHFFKNVAIAGGLLQVVAFGGGSFSFDERR